MPMSAIKERPILFSAPMVRAILEGRKTQTRRIIKSRKNNSIFMGGWTDSFILDEGNREWTLSECPYGQPGDHLWVRESWQKFGKEYAYAATDGDIYPETKWRPSIHMPRAASRLTLEITDIRAERLHDITEADAIAEGCESGGNWDSAPTVQYSNLWETINGPGSWEANPWVWVITFKKI